jgi:hypothetical protein
MGLIFALQWAGARVFIPSNLRGVVFNTRLVCASKRETFAGGVGHMRPGCGMIFQFQRWVDDTFGAWEVG